MTFGSGNGFASLPPFPLIFQKLIVIQNSGTHIAFYTYYCTLDKNNFVLKKQNIRKLGLQILNPAFSPNPQNQLFSCGQAAHQHDFLPVFWYSLVLSGMSRLTLFHWNFLSTIFLVAIREQTFYKGFLGTFLNSIFQLKIFLYENYSLPRVEPWTFC